MKAVRILVAALGGEGGGVLAEWLVDAAFRAGHAAQSTSIPGVAQRTGSTTYYIEVFDAPEAALGARQPLFGLNPVPGTIDLLVASELLEAARQVGFGMASADRTHVVASTGRTLTTAEKMAPGDGRADDARLLDVVRAASRQCAAIDVGRLAAAAGTAPSAVLFGAVFGSGVLPFDAAHGEAAIRGAATQGIEASVAGFRAAMSEVRRQRGAGASLGATPPSRHGADAAARRAEEVSTSDLQPLPRAPATMSAATRPVIGSRPASPGAAALPRGLRDTLPSVLHDIAALGHGRVVDWQDARYGDLYLERLRRIADAERRAPDADAELEATLPASRETARWLALWMAFDDIVRVAELKSRASRLARVRREARARDDEIVVVVDHFKPGIPELAAMLPPFLAGWLLGRDRRRVARGLDPLAWPLKLKTTTVLGLSLLRLLAATRRLRRLGSRWADEQQAIERWLGAVESGLARGAALGAEIAACGRLVKGYGSTHARGMANLRHVVDHLAVAAPLASVAERAAAIRAARESALADDHGLDAALVRHGAPPRPVAEQPIRWVRQRPGRPDTAPR